MKKLICLALVIVALAACLVGCGSFTCSLCGEEKSGDKIEMEILGETVTYCEDCANSLSELGNSMMDEADVDLEDLEDLF